MFGPGASRIVAALIALAILSSASSMIIAGPRVYFAMAHDGGFSERFRHQDPPLRPYSRHLSAVRMGHRADSCLRGLRKDRRIHRRRNHDFFRRHSCSRHRTQDANTWCSAAFHDAGLSMDRSSVRRDVRLDSYLRGNHPFAGNPFGRGNRDWRASNLLAVFARCEGESPDFTFRTISQFVNSERSSARPRARFGAAHNRY